MLREGLLHPIDSHRSRYTGDAFHFRTLADLRFFKAVISTVKFVGNYPGLFVWQLGNQRRKELLESPEKMAMRLKLK